MLKSSVRLLAVLVAGLGAAAACAAQALTIAISPSPLALPVEVARLRGFFAAEGVDVRVVDCASGPVCMQQLFQGKAQLVTVTELPVVNAGFERSDFALISTIATATGNIRLIGRKSAGIARAQDLVGLRVGAIAGTSSHYYLETYLMFHDIDPKQVKFVPLTNDRVVSAMAQREVDALSSYTRHAAAVMQRLKSDVVLLDEPRIYTETYNLVTLRPLLAQRPADVGKLLRALDRAERHIAQFPAEAKQLLVARTAIDPQQLDTIFPSFSYRLSLNQSLIASMEGQGRWAIREGHAQAKAVPNYLTLVDDGPLRAAVPTALPR